MQVLMWIVRNRNIYELPDIGCLKAFIYVLEFPVTAYLTMFVSVADLTSFHVYYADRSDDNYWSIFIQFAQISN
jgi:hypothetical protein